MKRWLIGFFVFSLLAMSFVAFPSSSSVTAQDDSAESQASEIADLQTRVAVLETAVAEGQSGQSTSDASTGRPVLAEEDGTPVAGEGEVLYEANQQTGFSGWTEGYFGGFSNQFTEQDGMLVAAPGFWTVLYAPYLPTTPDYIVEAEMRQPVSTVTPGVGTPAPVTSTIAGLAVRYWNASWDEQGGYTAYTWNDSPTLESPGDEAIANVTEPQLPFPPHPTDGEWHTYRVEIRGDTLRLLIDGALILEATGLQYQGYGELGRVGILVSLGAVDIRAFRVIAWE